MGNSESTTTPASSSSSAATSRSASAKHVGQAIRRHTRGKLPTDRDFLNVLVIVGQAESERYQQLFAKHGKLYGTHELRVVCALWNDIRLSCYSSRTQGLQAQADIKLSQPGGYQKVVSITVDFVLVRSQVCGAQPEQDWRNVLYGFIYANVPSVNSFQSIYMASQRVLMMAECNRIREAVGFDNFPVVDQNYYARAQDMAISPQFPAVVKVSAAHAGQGKIVVTDHHHWADIRSVVMVTDHYATAEAFVDGEYDLRIQRIASGVDDQPPHYRCLKRINISGNWKTNTGSAIMETMEMTDAYRRWADLAAQMFGGLDILAVDVIHCAKTGSEYILEVNDTAIGLAPDDAIALEDEQHIVQLCINRLKQHYPIVDDHIIPFDSASDLPAPTADQQHSIHHDDDDHDNVPEPIVVEPIVESIVESIVEPAVVESVVESVVEPTVVEPVVESTEQSVVDATHDHPSSDVE